MQGHPLFLGFFLLTVFPQCTDAIVHSDEGLRNCDHFFPFQGTWCSFHSLVLSALLFFFII